MGGGEEWEGLPESRFLKGNTEQGYQWFLLRKHLLSDGSTKHKHLGYSEILKATNLQIMPNMTVISENRKLLKYKTVIASAFIKFIT